MSEGGRPTLELRGDWWQLAKPRSSLRFLPWAVLAVLLVGPAVVPRPIRPLVLVGVVLGVPLALFAMVRRSRLTVSEDGVTDQRLWRRRHWSWDEAVVIAPGPVYRSRWSDASGAAYLMVCVRDDPYAHTLKGIGFAYNLDAMWCLDRIAKAGYPVERRTDASPEEWWVDDPRRRGEEP